jgi:hypothetical protein
MALQSPGPEDYEPNNISTSKVLARRYHFANGHPKRWRIMRKRGHTSSVSCKNKPLSWRRVRRCGKLVHREDE